MTSRSRVPRTLSTFDNYFKTLVPFLLDIPTGSTLHNWERLGLLQSEMTAISAFYVMWFTGIATNPGAYELHIDPEKKNKKTRRDVVKIMEDVSSYLQPLLTRMSGSANLTEGDMLVLNIKIRKTFSFIKKVIESIPHIVQIALGQARVRLKFYDTQDSKKPSIPEGADSIEIAYIILDPLQETELQGKVKKTAPKHPDDGCYKEIHTRATIILDFETIHAGKQVYLFARFYHTKHHDLAGTWTPVYIFRIPY